MAVPIQIGVAQFQPADFGPKRNSLKLFRVNLALEQLRIAQLHELVRIASVAVFAAIFAAPIRVDGPDGPHAA